MEYRYFVSYVHVKDGKYTGFGNAEARRNRPITNINDIIQIADDIAIDGEKVVIINFVRFSEDN